MSLQKKGTNEKNTGKIHVLLAKKILELMGLLEYTNKKIHVMLAKKILENARNQNGSTEFNL